MTSAVKDTPTGRFLFDPSYSVARVPTIEALVFWAYHRMVTPDTALHKAMSGVYQTHDVSKGLWGQMLNLIPYFARRRHEELTESSIDAARRELMLIRNLMLEFGVDPLHHARMPEDMETLLSYVVLEPIERATRDRLEDIRRHNPAGAQEVDQALSDTRIEERIAYLRSLMRQRLENEALQNILENPDFQRDHTRRTGALRAASEEVQHKETRDMLLGMLATVDGGRA